MWTTVLVIYVAGLSVTALVLLRTRMFKHEPLMDAGSILFWPFYWGFYLAALLQYRKRP